jgi:hypothetical protein
VAHVAVGTGRVGPLAQGADEALVVGRLDQVVVEVEEGELGLHLAEKEVDVSRPAEPLAVGDDLDPRILGGVGAADLLGRILGEVDRDKDPLVGVGLLASAAQGPLDELGRLVGGDADGDGQRCELRGRLRSEPGRVGDGT